MFKRFSAGDCLFPEARINFAAVVMLPPDRNFQTFQAVTVFFPSIVMVIHFNVLQLNNNTPNTSCIPAILACGYSYCNQAP